MLCASLFGHFVKFEADPLLEESLERGGYRRAHAEEAEVAQQRARGRSIGAAIRYSRENASTRDSARFMESTF